MKPDKINQPAKTPTFVKSQKRSENLRVNYSFPLAYSSENSHQ